MSRAVLSSLVVLSLAATPAWATIEIFFTNASAGYGLSDPSRAFQPTAGNDLDPNAPGIQGDDGAVYNCFFPPVSIGPEHTPDLSPFLGEFAYIWLRFDQQPLNQKIFSMLLSQPQAQDVAYYIQNDLGGDSGSKRWDNPYTLPGAPEFKQKINQSLDAAANAGLRNVANTTYDWNLYDRITHTYLLGAVRYDQPGLFSIDIPNDYTGINVGGTTYVARAIGSCTCYAPEPASALAGMALLLCASARGVRRGD